MIDPFDRLADALREEPFTEAEIAALKARLGIEGEAGHLLGNLRYGRPVKADAFLSAHAVKGWDPLTSRAADPDMPAPAGRVLWGWFGIRLQIVRMEADLKHRAAAKAAGVSLSSWNRAENGNEVGTGIFLALCAYADRHPWQVCKREVSRETLETY